MMQRRIMAVSLLVVAAPEEVSERGGRAAEGLGRAVRGPGGEGGALRGGTSGREFDGHTSELRFFPEQGDEPELTAATLPRARARSEAQGDRCPTVPATRANER